MVVQYPCIDDFKVLWNRSMRMERDGRGGIKKIFRWVLGMNWKIPDYMIREKTYRLTKRGIKRDIKLWE